MNRPFSIFVFLLSITTVIAQELKDYSPKSPEAVALDKFIDIPPGSYTGVAGYSVPIYNIELENYSIPITLNYHGMGIKVNEVSSSVGLGWSLNIGGISLSKQVMGLNDNDVSRIDIALGDFQFDVNTHPDYEIALSLSNGVHELMPDYFSYSLLHNSGKFIVDNIGNAQTIPKDDVIINGYAELIDNQGIKYRFMQQLDSFSVTGSSTGSSISESAIPSYNIEQIIFPSGKTILFEYIDSSHSYIVNHTETKSIYDNHANLTNVDVFDGQCSAEQNSISRATYFITEKVISKIIYDNAEINFTYDTQDREDIGGKKLNTINVQSVINNSKKSIRNYNLITSYWQSGTPLDNSITSSNPLYNGLVKRLRLDTVQETFSGKSYSFDYYEDHAMPYRLSKDTDFWGLYNGKNNRSYTQQYTYYDTNNYLRVSDGANRSPALEYAQIGALKKVHLPTGGFQEFQYELDDYKFDTTENLFYKRFHQVSVTPDMFDNGNLINIPINISGSDYRDGFDYKIEFNWDNNPLTENEDSNNNGQINLPTDPYYTVNLIDQYGNNIQTLYHNIEVRIPPLEQGGSYFLQFYKSPNHTQNVSDNVSAKLTWYQNNSQYIANKKAGNLRVKSIILNQSNGEISLKRNYTYTNPNTPGFSSGSFRTFSESYITENPYAQTGFFCRYINYSNNYDVNTSTFKGKSVVYEHVKEEFVSLNNPAQNYYIQKKFSLPIIQGYPQPNKLPKTPFVDNSFTGGLLLNSQTINSNGLKVSEVINGYSFDNYFNNDSYNNHIGGVGSNAVSGGLIVQLKSDFSCCLKYNYNYYYYPSTWVKLNETTNKSYFNSSSFVEQKTIYQYDSNYRHIKPIRETTTNSAGKAIKTEYSYPQELNNFSDLSHQEILALTQLETDNRIASPFQTETIVEDASGDVLSKNTVRTIYKDWGNGLILPESVEALKGETTILEPRINYHKYDTYGNPLEVSKTNGTPISYIWGYNHQYPVAKIENATYAQIEALSSFGTGFSLGANGLTASQELQLRSLTNAQVTTYKYKPLVGVISTTDPRGYTTYYEYDAFNRLKQVKDAEGNILSKNDYNYANQN